MRILLIEDDPHTARSIEMMLCSTGFRIFATDTGGDGADLAKIYD